VVGRKRGAWHSGGRGGLLTYGILGRQPLLKVRRLAAENVAMDSPALIAAFNQDVPFVLRFPESVERLVKMVTCVEGVGYCLRDVAPVVGGNH
jgi:hypothetical protein